MANRHLKLDPHPIHEWAWWYEVPRGIEIFAQCSSDKMYPDTKHYTISWEQVRAALRRKDQRV